MLAWSAGSCKSYWSKYSSKTVAADSRFVVDYKTIQVNGSDGLKDLRTVFSRGSPIFFGTSFYTAFYTDTGNPSPYMGNGTIQMENGEQAGHAMLIIGYDDTYGKHDKGWFGWPMTR
jgi:C1A family cysteine protease